MNSEDERTEPMAKLLHIEDDPAHRDLVKHLLAEHGFDIEEAPDLQHALKCLDQHRYDVILVDVSLPDSSQDQTVRAIKQHTSSAVIVVLTGNDDREFARQTVMDNASDCLFKGHEDCSGTVLARRIRTAIKTHSNNSALRQMIAEEEEHA